MGKILRVSISFLGTLVWLLVALMGFALYNPVRYLFLAAAISQAFSTFSWIMAWNPRITIRWSEIEGKGGRRG